MVPKSHDIGTIGKTIMLLAGIVSSIGVLATAVAWSADHRYMLRAETRQLIQQTEKLVEDSQVRAWRDQVEIIQLKQAADINLTDDDKIKKQFYQNKIDTYNQLNRP